MNIKNWKIGTRMGLGFGVVLALLLIVVVVCLIKLAAVNDSLRNVVDVNNVKLDAATDMRDAQRRIAIAVRNIILVSDEKSKAEQEKKAIAARGDYDKAAALLDRMIKLDEGKAILARIHAAHDLAMPMMDKSRRLGLENKAAEATQVLIEEVTPVARQWQDALSDMLDHQADLNHKSAQLAQQDYGHAQFMLACLGVIAIFLGVLIGWASTSSITRPLNTAVKIAQRVAGGDLNSQIEVNSTDETGLLMQALKEMNDALRKIVGQVRSGTDAMAMASGEIARGNLDLSSRTEQQASALEETASSMEEMTTTVKQNANNSHQANALAGTASQVAVRGGSMVAQVVETMGAINDSSRKIVDIISVIDGIAFQTNILALNAAVEAARAGEQGRGFAVVASEVRNLAQRSAAAAKEIKTLIGDSVEKVASGAKLVAQTGSTMDEIVASVQRVTDIMVEITAASREQEAGIEQINQAISEMDTVTQQNAALVEEAAAAAESLQEQSAGLAQVVSIFKIDVGAPDTPAQPVLATSAKATQSDGKRAKQVGNTRSVLNRWEGFKPVAATPAMAGSGWEEF